MASGSEEGTELETEDIDKSIRLTTDVELLKQAWRNEKASPEILKFQADLVQRSKEQIQLMEDTVEDYEGNGTDPLTISLYQMDLDRYQFLLRSYLRTRLQKIEKYTIHISKTEMWNRLSRPEQKFAKRCKDSMEKHLTQSVLSKLPEGYRSILQQSASSDAEDMVPEPQLDTFVFCKSNQYREVVQVGESGDEQFDFAVDGLGVIRYTAIRELVETGKVDLV
ncbi:hypothetical protein GIB67_011345 [Kingdonia uniflora]|uniref:DNA replication complex GINS protein SLD5 n=1 Tax=Kingdonia uniflora TaxID=39325 RepID=A0A7J7MDM9_9MAGN|nr:hypothetical protein GIB67_011345 [Kingdonia uniflora]